MKNQSYKIEIINKYNLINDVYDKLRFISQCSGVKLIIKDNRFWFELFGKQITPKDIYIKNSSFARTLNAACNEI
jgi:hypothetical protein